MKVFKNGHLLRFTSLVLVVLLIFADLGQAQTLDIGLGGSIDKLQTETSGHARELSRLASARGLALPRDLGSIRMHEPGSLPAHIFHIQDMHINETAQIQVAKIVDYLTRQYNVKLIQLEGASGELAHRPLSLYPNEKARRLGARAFLQNGFLTGPEYLAITRRPDLILYGVEDAELYARNRSVLLKIIEKSGGDSSLLEPFEQKLNALVPLVFSEEAREWFRLRRAYENSPSEMMAYIHYLIEKCPAAADACSGEQMKLLLKSEELERGIDSARLLEELKQLDLIGAGESERLNWARFRDTILLSDLKAVRKQEKKWQDFIPYLRAEKTSGQIERFMEFFEVTSRINLEVYDEIQAAGKIFEDALFTGDHARTLYRLFRILSVYRHLFTLELTREEAEYLYANRHAFASKWLEYEVKNMLSHYGFDREAMHFTLAPLEETLGLYESFYSCALQRDETLVKHAVESMHDYRENVTILITGGFHTAGIEKAFRERGLGFTTITPLIASKIDEKMDQKIYQKAMGLKASLISELLEEKNLYFRDPKLQMQVPSRLPSMPQVQAFGSGEQKLQGLEGEVLMMTVFSVLGKIFASSAEEFEVSDDQMSGGELRFASTIYSGFDTARPLIRRESPNAGRLLLPAHPFLGFGLEARWKPGTRTESNSAPVFSGNHFEVFFPGDMQVSFHFIHEPALYQTIRKGYPAGRGRSELRSTALLDFAVNPETIQAWTAEDTSFVEGVLRFQKVSDALRRALDFKENETAEKLHLEYTAFTEQESGERILEPGSPEIPGKRIYKLMIDYGGSRHNFIVSRASGSRKFNFRAYSRRLNEIDEMLRKAKTRMNRPVSPSEIMRVPVKPNASVFVKNISTDRSEAYEFEERVSAARIKVQVHKGEASVSAADRDEKKVYQTERGGEVYSLITSPVIDKDTVIDFTVDEGEGDLALSAGADAKSEELTDWTASKASSDAELDALVKMAVQEYEETQRQPAFDPLKLNDDEFIAWADANPDKIGEHSPEEARLFYIATRSVTERTQEPALKEQEPAPKVFQAPREKFSSRLPVYLIDIPFVFLVMLSGPDLIWQALFGAVFLRLGFIAALLVHEWSHIFAATGKGSWSFKNFLGNRKLVDWIRGVMPFQPIPSSAHIETRKPSKTLLIRNAGWLGGGLYLAALITGAYFFKDSLIVLPLLAMVPGAVLGFIAGFVSDVIYPSELPCVHGCGNQGVLIGHHDRKSGALLPADVEEILERMGKVTKVRGEQAAGRAIMTADGIVQIRHVNNKRSDLAEDLREKSRKAARRAHRSGKQALDNHHLVMEHYRYGTSSAPAVVETHPHIWKPEKKRPVWAVDNKRVSSVQKHVSFAITHNGDFDSWELFGEQVPMQVIGLWLERVLQVPNHTEGDSPKIAGMMGFLMTQGLWDESVRYAYQMTVATSVSDAFAGEDPAAVWNDVVRSFPTETPYIELKREFNRRLPKNTAPSEETMRIYARLFESVFEKQKEIFALPGVDDLSDIPAHLQQELIRQLKENLRGNSFFKNWDDEKLVRFIETTVHAFFYHNAYNATQYFLSKVMGSFGLVVVSSLEPEQFVTAAQGQPISLGFHPDQDLIAYASEASALKVPLPDGSLIPYRIDLDQFGGEIAMVRLDGLRIYSRKAKRELTREELEYSGRIIDMRDNELVEPLQQKKASHDPVGDDIRDIPKVVDAIRTDWRTPESFNHRTAGAFTAQLAEKVQDPAKKARPGELDILIAGIEVSQWLGEQFAEDLRAVYPQLNIGAVSGNKILESLQDGSLGSVTKDTIILFLSQSGQTFPSLNAVTGLSAAYAMEQAHPGRVFVMTGEIDTPLGAAIGQRYYRGAPFSERIFTNGSGRRPAEPSSVAAAAGHSSLTELLLHIMRELPKVSGVEEPFGQKVKKSQLKNLLAVRDGVIDRGLVSIVGYTALGERVSSSENKTLTRLGRKWASHILEPAVIWGLSALYVLITVVFGVPLFGTVYGLGVAPWLDGLNPVAASAAMYVFRALDAGLYIFLGYFLALGLRLNPFNRREVFARTGKRTIVIGDLPYIHQSLEQFVTKLFSMSYGHASVDVHGANPRDHMLHRFGHRVVRGVLLFLGVPDGRLKKFQVAENNVLMTAKQGKGVRNFGVGAEVVTVAHRPINNKNASDQEVTLATHLENVPEDPVVQTLYDTRFASFERWISAFVFFYSMARKVSRFYPLQYDMSRTQSGTRIATTAAPVSAAALGDLLRGGTELKAVERVLDTPQKLPFRVLRAKETSITETEAGEEVKLPEPTPEAKKVSFEMTPSLVSVQKLLLGRHAAAVLAALEANPDSTGSEADALAGTASEAWWDETQTFLLEQKVPEGFLRAFEKQLPAAAFQISEKHRNELRTQAEPALLEALDSMDAMRKTIRIQEVFDFKPYLDRIHAQGLTLEQLFQAAGPVSVSQNPVYDSGSALAQGEVLLVYRDRMHQPGFAAEIAAKLKAESGIRQIHVIRDRRTDWENWNVFKLGLSAEFNAGDERLTFHENRADGAVQGFVEAHLSSMGLDASHALQIISPENVAGDQLAEYETTLLAAVPLGRETVLILGAAEPVQGVKGFTFAEFIEERMAAYREIFASA